MTSHPLISVITPAYNCESYIQKAIDSILNQSVTDLELIICDDGSTDNTLNVIGNYDDKRIRKYRNEKNKGYLATYNYLLTLTQGSFICCQDADDWSDSRRLELQLEIFHRFPDVSMVATNGVFWYSDSVQRQGTSFKDGYVTFDKDEFKFMNASMMYRRNVVDKVKGFHPYFDRLTSMDQYFIMDILSEFKGYAINRYLYFARFNPTSNHRTLDYDRKLTIHEAYLLLKKQRLETGTDWLKQGRSNDLLEYEKSLLGNHEFMAEKYREYAVYRIDSGKPWRASTLLFKALFLNPFYGKTYRTIFYWLKKIFRFY